MTSSRDAWAGAFFAAIGLLALFLARGYPVGNAFQMGPGYFPIAVGILLVVLGLLNILRGLRGTGGGTVGRFAWRPFLLIPLAVLAFGLLIDQHGLMVAAVALVIISRIGGAIIRPIETAVMCVVLAAAAAALFVYGLGLPLQLVLPQ